MFSYFRAILLMGFTFYLSLIYNNKAFALLGFIQAVLIIFSFVFFCYYKRRIRIGLSVPLAFADKNEKAALRLHISNCSFVVGNRAKVKIAYRSVLEKKKNYIWISLANISRGDSEISCPVSAKYAGCYEFSLERIRLYDLTGFFYWNLRSGIGDTLMVMPEIEEVALQLGEATLNFSGEADIYDETHPGNDSSEMFAVREFRAGDRIQNIHWKLSAKMDDLAVRENSLPKACPVVFLLSPSYGTKQKMQSAQQMEEYFHWMASISYTFMDMKCSHYIAWDSKAKRDILRVRVDDEESFYLFLMTYMSDQKSEALPDLQARYKEKYRGENYLHMLLLNGEPKLWLNGEALAAEKRQDIELVI